MFVFESMHFQIRKSFVFDEFGSLPTRRWVDFYPIRNESKSLINYLDQNRLRLPDLSWCEPYVIRYKMCDTYEKQKCAKLCDNKCPESCKKGGFIATAMGHKYSRKWDPKLNIKCV